MRGRHLYSDHTGWDDEIWMLAYADGSSLTGKDIDDETVRLPMTAGNAMKAAMRVNATLKRRGSQKRVIVVERIAPGSLLSQKNCVSDK